VYAKNPEISTTPLNSGADLKPPSPPLFNGNYISLPEYDYGRIFLNSNPN
jgi:hypothetical protein